jgi:hypothetical protein
MPTPRNCDPIAHRPLQPILTSWKDIAAYTGKGVRTVQRWEHTHGLPIRRPSTNNHHKTVVVLYRSDLELWMKTHFLLATPSARQALVGEIAHKLSELGSALTGIAGQL